MKPPASPAANPNPSSRRRTYQGAGKREPYRIAATAGREAMMRLGVACAQMVAEGGRPKASWWPVLAYIIAGEEGITAYSRTCDEVSIRNMARWTALSRNTVKAAMSDLQAMGIIKYETVGAVKGQAVPSQRAIVALPLSPERRQAVMESGDNTGEGSTQTDPGGGQPRLTPSEQFEKNLKRVSAGSTRKGSTQTDPSPRRAVAAEHLPTPSKATPPKDMTPEKVKAREAIQREIDERRSRPPGYAVKAAHSHDDKGTNGNGNGHPAGNTNTTAQAINRTPAIHENADHSWVHDAVEMHHEDATDRDRFDALAGMPRGW